MTTVPLEKIAQEDSELFYCNEHLTDLVSSISDITKVELSLKKAPSFTPHWAAGVDVAGPSIGFSVTGQWYPVPSLVLEGGILPAGPMLGGWAGLRVRGRLSQLFVGTIGGSAGGLVFAGDANSDSKAGNETPTRFLVGPRVGMEYAPDSSQHIFRLEMQAAYTDLAWPGNARWIPWGGFSYAHCY